MRGHLVCWKGFWEVVCWGLLKVSSWCRRRREIRDKRQIPHWECLLLSVDNETADFRELKTTHTELTWLRLHLFCLWYVTGQPHDRQGNLKFSCSLTLKKSFLRWILYSLRFTNKCSVVSILLWQGSAQIYILSPLHLLRRFRRFLFLYRASAPLYYKSDYIQNKKLILGKIVTRTFIDLLWCCT